MAANPLEHLLRDLQSDYAEVPVPPRLARLYEDDPEWAHVFGVLHKQLNDHFDGINSRIGDNYWAEPSRELIKLMDKLDGILYALERGGAEVEFSKDYQETLERCRPWLSRSYGSPVPQDFERIKVENYAPVFSRSSTTVKLVKQSQPAKLSMVGEGAYALVHSYVDPDYGIKFALKRARKNLSPRDLERFKAEFSYMKRLSHPNLVEVYRYDDTSDSYRMEFCDETLRDFIDTRNGILESSKRKQLALQFLSALRYLHGQQILHRDISLQNVLVKVYGSGDVQVKVSDFGLAKDQTQDFTLTETEMRGTIPDPMLGSFKTYAVANEMWGIAHVLSYIISGRKGLLPHGSPLGDIVQRCASMKLEDRYESVAALIEAIEAL